MVVVVVVSVSGLTPFLLPHSDALFGRVNVALAISLTDAIPESIEPQSFLLDTNVVWAARRNSKCCSEQVGKPGLVWWEDLEELVVVNQLEPAIATDSTLHATGKTPSCEAAIGAQ